MERVNAVEVRVDDLSAHWKSDMLQLLDDARAETAKVGAIRVRREVIDKNWATIRASVQPHRRGVWPPINLPAAISEAFQIALLQYWKDRVGADVGTIVGELEQCSRFCIGRLESLAEFLREATVGQLRAAIAHSGEILAACVERVSQDVQARYQEAGLYLPEQVASSTRDGLGEPCASALVQRGAGCKERMIQSLTRGTPSVGDYVVDDMPQYLNAAAERLRGALQAEGVAEVRRALTGVFSDIERFLLEMGSGTGGSGNEGIVAAALASVPEWTLPIDSVPPSVSR
jgi:hypothetical protein